MQQCAGAVNEYLAAVNLPPMNPASTWTPNGNTGASNAFPSTLAGAQAQAQAPIGVGVGVGAGANTSNNNQQGNKGMMDPFHYTNLGGHQHQLQSQQQQQRQQQQQQQQMQNQSGLHTQAQNGGVNPTALAIAALNASNAQAMAAAPPAQVQAQTPDNAPKKRGRKPTKEKKYKDPNAPKRPPSAYLLFQNEVMQQIRQTNPDMQYKEVLTNIANRWKQLTPEEKKVRTFSYLTPKQRERRESGGRILGLAQRFLEGVGGVSSGRRGPRNLPPGTPRTRAMFIGNPPGALADQAALRRRLPICPHLVQARRRPVRQELGSCSKRLDRSCFERESPYSNPPRRFLHRR